MPHARTRENIRTSMIVGLVLATLYAAYATIVYLTRGSELFSKYDATLGTVIASYYGAGILGGAVVGLLLPLRRGWAGALLLGLVAALVACFCIEIAMSGPFWRWNAANWEEVFVLGGFFGIVATYLFRPRR